MNIHLAADHAGYELKEFLKIELTNLGYNFVDHGADSLDANDDYPDFVIPCAQAVAEEPSSLGIIIGGSGQGEAMCANSVTGARAAVFYGPQKAILAVDITGAISNDPYEIIRIEKEHNNANILSLGARFITHEQALHAVKLFLETEFLGTERHLRRINKFN